VSDLEEMLQAEASRRPSTKQLREFFGFAVDPGNVKSCNKGLLLEAKDLLINPPLGVQGGPVKDNLTQFEVKFRVLDETSPFYGMLHTSQYAC
jgi:hypothetical protein